MGIIDFVQSTAQAFLGDAKDGGRSRKLKTARRRRKFGRKPPWEWPLAHFGEYCDRKNNTSSEKLGVFWTALCRWVPLEVWVCCRHLLARCARGGMADAPDLGFYFWPFQRGSPDFNDND
jgi:hypothetical protein